MKKFLITLIVLSILATPSAAQVSVKDVKIGLQKIFVGDEVDCTITIENKNSYPERVTSVVFFSDLVRPRIISNIGVIPPQSTYELPFTFKSEKPGKFFVEVKVSTPNGSVTYYIPFVVESKLPEVILENSTIYLNEENLLKIRVDSDFDVYIEPLFNASPSVVYGREALFVYYPMKKEKVAFKVYFYNGRNYHEYVKEFQVEWKKSRGVYFEIKAPEKVLLYDAARIDVYVTNLKRETVYNLRIKALDKEYSYPSLLPGQSKNFSIYVTAFKPSTFDVSVELSYENREVVRETKRVEIEVLNESSVDICNYEFEEDVIRGEICNRGLSEISGVVVSFNDVKTFVGSVAPGDFEIFEVKAKNESGVLRLEWRNLAGDLLRLEKFVEREKVEVKKSEVSPAVLIVSIAAAIAIILLAVVALRKR